MIKTMQWVVGVSVVLIAATVVVPAVWMFAAHGLGWSNSYGMMAAGAAHMPMMSQMGGYGMRGSMLGGMGMPFMGLGMFLRLLVLVSLIVLGILWIRKG